MEDFGSRIPIFGYQHSLFTTQRNDRRLDKSFRLSFFHVAISDGSSAIFYMIWRRETHVDCRYYHQLRCWLIVYPLNVAKCISTVISTLLYTAFVNVGLEQPKKKLLKYSLWRCVRKRFLSNIVSDRGEEHKYRGLPYANGGTFCVSDDFKFKFGSDSFDYSSVRRRVLFTNNAGFGGSNVRESLHFRFRGGGFIWIFIWRVVCGFREARVLISGVEVTPYNQRRISFPERKSESDTKFLC